ncbi:uncharacterized protein LOC120158821 [Hibiscus syriacus]|uniref:uncharacterized protein LOC120158821 n=1 Tax=Hibiscus syriacus TaxID=106335 RepID=UPI001920E501|nr:uncharacterized protein LOC120158821 [Hibiscus syriacus]
MDIIGLNTIDYDWKQLFGIIIWRLWKNINCFIFRGKVWSSTTTIHSAKAWAHVIRSTCRSYSGSMHRRKATYCWRVPETNSFTLNTDGAMDPATKAVACGGVIRNNNRDRITRFCRNIGHCLVLQEEPWGVLDGLELALSLGVN